jgi:hypothetical protein
MFVFGVVIPVGAYNNNCKDNFISNKSEESKYWILLVWCLWVMITIAFFKYKNKIK